LSGTIEHDQLSFSRFPKSGKLFDGLAGKELFRSFILETSNHFQATIFYALRKEYKLKQREGGTGTIQKWSQSP